MSYSIKFLLIFIISGCGETNYLLTSDTPPILEGFYGFRWTTPMSVVDAEFPKRTGATPIDSLNRYNTSNFSDAYFLDELTSVCLFGFNENGLSSVKILFNTDYQNFGEKLFYLEKKLSDIFGKPLEYFGNPSYKDSPEYFSQLQWIRGRLKLTLLTNYILEISAFGYEPFESIHNK